MPAVTGGERLVKMHLSRGGYDDELERGEEGECGSDWKWKMFDRDWLLWWRRGGSVLVVVAVAVSDLSYD